MDEQVTMSKLPLNPKYQIYDFQQEAIDFMQKIESKTWPNHMRGGLLYMNMGLGKSLISVAHSWLSLAERVSQDSTTKPLPTLILTSKLLMNEWKSECFETMMNDNLKVLYLHSDYTSSSIMNSLTRSKVMEYDFIVTTYDVLAPAFKQANIETQVQVKKNKRIQSIRQRTKLQCDDARRTGLPVLYYTPWRRIIADESQVFVNPNTNLFQHVMGLYGDYMWCLTGTPVRNQAVDLWSQLRFCGFDCILQPQKWKLLYEQYIQSYNLLTHVHEVHYCQTGIELPPLHEEYQSIAMNPKQRQCYEVLKTAYQTTDAQSLTSPFKTAVETSPLYLVALFSKMRQCVVAPCLLSSCFTGTTPTDLILSTLLQPWRAWLQNSKGSAGFKSPKLVALLTQLNAIPEGEKVLIFSVFTGALRLVHQLLKQEMPEKRVGLIYGATASDVRKKHIDGMKQGHLDILFMSYKVGSCGLNLTQANHVICLEEWWTPDVLAQAIARCHRSGQKREVYAHHFITIDSIEERCVTICQKKRKLQSKITQPSPFKMTPQLIKAILT